MNIETAIYLGDILPSIDSGISAVLFLSIIFGIIALFVICKVLECGSEKEVDKAYIKTKELYFRGIKIWLILLFFSALIPSQKTIYLMLGANYLKTSTLPTKVELAIEKKIDSYLADDSKDSK